jgi:hypothetical protein
MKIHPVGDEMFHAEEQTDGRTNGQTHMTKLIVAFRNFAKAPVIAEISLVNQAAWKLKAKACNL